MLLGQGAGCVTSGKAVRLSRRRGNSETGDAPPRLLSQLVRRPHSLRYCLVLKVCVRYKPESALWDITLVKNISPTAVSP
eukprot:6210120-Pleurochrysis_carterae.AAC.1